jgi:hypothetical protein
MPLKFNCSHCGEPIIVKYLHIGEEASCLHCGEWSVVPADSEVTDEEAYRTRRQSKTISSGLSFYYFSGENILKKAFRELFVGLIFVFVFAMHEQWYYDIGHFIFGISIFILAILLSSYADKYKPPMQMGIKREAKQ